jgi:hypothetical protein
MKILSKILEFNYAPLVRSSLNLGGVALVVAGVFMLPIDLSFRLIILGLCALILWQTVSD